MYDDYHLGIHRRHNFTYDGKNWNILKKWNIFSFSIYNYDKSDHNTQKNVNRHRSKGLRNLYTFLNHTILTLIILYIMKKNRRNIYIWSVKEGVQDYKISCQYRFEVITTFVDCPSLEFSLAYWIDNKKKGVRRIFLFSKFFGYIGYYLLLWSHFLSIRSISSCFATSVRLKLYRISFLLT